MAASFNSCAVTLLVWSRRRTSLAASWTPMLDVCVGPAVGVWRLQDVSQDGWLVCWWGWWVGWGAGACGVGVRGLPRQAHLWCSRRAVPSAGAGEWDWSCWMRRLIKGAWNARACVVLLGMSVPCVVWRGFRQRRPGPGVSPGFPGGGV